MAMGFYSIERLGDKIANEIQCWHTQNTVNGEESNHAMPTHCLALC